MRIGKLKHKINVTSVFYELSKDDEESAYILAENMKFRQACYLLIQAMEKAIRAKIFSLVNPNIEYFRDRNRTHSLDSAVEFLIEIVSTDNLIREQVSLQLKAHVLGDTQYSHLHNNLRYPSYFKNYNSYSIIEVGKSDFEVLNKRLQLLRMFLDDLYKFT